MVRLSYSVNILIIFCNNACGGSFGLIELNVYVILAIILYEYYDLETTIIINTN